MGKFIKLNTSDLKELRKVDPRLVSYNVEMTEVTGGTFWSAYTEAQVEGIEEVSMTLDLNDLGSLQQYYEPVDLYNERLRKLARELGTVWVRVSGTWANKTYYDFDGHTNGEIPDGYQNVLTKEQWIGVLEFVKHIDGKLLISVANCPGNHSADEPWNSEQAKMLFDFSRDYGVPINAAEFTNEPNIMQVSGLPEGYTTKDFTRDHDIFCRFIRENYPEVLIVGPCTCGDVPGGLMTADQYDDNGNNVGGGIGSAFEMITTDQLIGDAEEKIDVFSYHYYNGISERGAAMGGCWKSDKALTEQYLKVAGVCARHYATVRDKYVPGGQIWVTESGDAGCGGTTWASTYLDVPRTLNEFGEFATVTDGIIFHNTLASSDYGYLAHSTFVPRPSYFAALLWNRLMGQTVYDCGTVSEGAHVFAHSRKDGKEGIAYLVINNSLTETTTVELPKEADVYMLSGDGKLRSRTMLLNGRQLVLGENDKMPSLEPEKVSAGTLEVAPGNCTFIIL